jgi:hypothetical protein
VSLGRTIHLACLNRHVLLDRKSEDELGVRHFGGGPLAPDLRQLLVENKAEVLRFLAWRDQGREAIAQAFARVAHLYVLGVRLDAAEIRDAERELHDAFWVEDGPGFERALRRWRLACRRAIAAHWDARSGAVNEYVMDVANGDDVDG